MSPCCLGACKFSSRVGSPEGDHRVRGDRSRCRSTDHPGWTAADFSGQSVGLALQTSCSTDTYLLDTIKKGVRSPVRRFPNTRIDASTFLGVPHLSARSPVGGGLLSPCSLGAQNHRFQREMSTWRADGVQRFGLGGTALVEHELAPDRVASYRRPEEPAP